MSLALNMDDRRYPNRPMIGVGAVVFKGEDILMIKRGKPPRKGGWSLPGGLQELGETVFAAAIREVMEETNVEIDNLRLLDTIDYIERDDTGQVEFHYTLIDVVSEWVAGEARGGSDAADARWFSADEIDRLDIWSETKRIIALARG